MGGTYFLFIGNNSAHATVAFAYGDLDEINFIARRRVAELAKSTHEFTVRLVETANVADLDEDGLPADVKRTVTEFSGDGDTAAVVLKRKLAAERKQAIELIGPGTERLKQESGGV